MGPPMRSILIGAAALLLSGSAVAEPSVPTQLAETGPTCWQRASLRRGK